MMKRLMTVLAVLLALCGNSVAANSYGIPDKIQEGNILHCFDWSMSDVKAELPNIAAAGFGAVQLSPLQRGDIRTGSSWHDLYRPYDLAFKASSGLGSANDLKDLCSEAAKYGIKVIVDVVANHVDKTAGYHDTWWDSNGRIRWNGGINYGDRYSITHGQLGDYGDINSESAEVIARAKAYIQDLANMGVKGIRWDAAKHIGLPSEGCNFWKEVTSVAGVWHYGEILNEVGPNNSLIKEYAQYMSVTDNRYGNSASQNGGIPNGYAGEWVGGQGLSDTKVVYWGESHDTYSNDEWSQNVNQDIIDRAWAANACRNGATALYFSRPNAKGFGNIKVGKGSTHFKDAQIAEVNKFRNAMVGKADYFTSNGNAVSITRQGGGAVIVMKGSGNVSIANGGGYCPAGTYKDRVSGGTFTVTNSTITGTVGSCGIAVIYGEITKDASLSFTPAGGEFVGTVTVKVSPVNCSSAWYKVGSGAQVNVSGDTQFTLGGDMSVGQSVTVSWSATGESGTKTGSVTFKKVEKPTVEANTIYFDNTSSNWATPYVHYWGGSSESTWPGEQMEKVSGQIWKKKVPEGTTGLVFNNGQGTQTGDMTCTVGHLYSQSGDQGAYGGGNTDPEPGPGPGPVDPTPADMPSQLYVLGNIKGNSWQTTSGVQMTRMGNLYVAQNIELEAAAGENNCYFNLTDKLGSSWDELNANANRWGAATEGAPVGVGQSAPMQKYTNNVDASACKSWAIASGKYDLVADFSSNTVYAKTPGSMGIEDVMDDADQTPLYFNLQGVQVQNPGAGVYIVKRGAKVSKVVLR